MPNPSELDPRRPPQLHAQWFRAVELGNWQRLDSMLREHEHDVDLVGPKGTTALMEAAWAGREEAAELLLRHGARPNREARAGGTALAYAVAGNHVGVVELLLAAGADPNLLDSRRGGTPLTQACNRGHGDMMRLLLEHGADPWIAAPGAANAVEMAAGMGRIELLELLLEWRGRSRPADWASRTFWGASAGGQRLLAESLLDRGADPKWRRGGRSALHQCAATGLVDMVRYLVELGLDPDEVTPTGCTPLLLAIQARHRRVALALLEVGADPDIGEGRQGVTPLMQAAARGDLEMVTALLDHGATTSAIEQEGRSALDLATAAGQEEVASLLRARG